MGDVICEWPLILNFAQENSDKKFQIIDDSIYSRLVVFPTHKKKLILPIKGSFKSVYKDWKNVDDFFSF